MLTSPAQQNAAPTSPPGLRLSGALSYRRKAVKRTIQATTSSGASFRTDPPPESQAAPSRPITSASPSASARTRTLVKRRKNLRPESLFGMSLKICTGPPRAEYTAAGKRVLQGQPLQNPRRSASKHFSQAAMQEEQNADWLRASLLAHLSLSQFLKSSLASL